MSNVVVGLALFMLASTSIHVLADYSIAFRAIGACVIMLPVTWRRARPVHPSQPSFRTVMLAVGMGFFVYLIGSNYLHGQILAFLSGLFAFVLVAAQAIVLQRHYRAQEVVHGTYLALLMICAASLIFSQLDPATAFEHHRLRGVLENANGLGFVAFGLGSVSLAGHLKPCITYLGLGVAATCLLMSASRASALALTVFALLLAAAGLGRARRVVLNIALALVMLWLVTPEFLPGQALFRTTDTRPGALDLLDRTLHESLWVGLGKPEGRTFVAGSPLAAAITGGVVGAFGIGVMYVALVRPFLSRAHSSALIVAAVIHSYFESWMLSFSGPMMLTFIVLLVALTHLDTRQPTPAPRRAAGSAARSALSDGLVQP